MFNLEKIIMGRTSNHPMCFFWAVSSRQMATRGVAFWLHRLIPNGDPADFSGELLGPSAFWETRTVKPE